MHDIQSPRTDDSAIEAEIVAKGLTAPRVTPQDIADNIVATDIVKHVSAGGKVLRWAVLTTRNGFAVTGRPSASVSPENDDAEVGVKVAFENAKNEMWALMGYALAERLAEHSAQVPQPPADNAHVAPGCAPFMRTLEDHKVNPANDVLTITVADKPGSGGANHAYVLTGANLNSNQSLPALWANGVSPETGAGMAVLFQNGPIAEVGVNGITHEALLAILADRLRGFQAGAYACDDNREALEHIEAAQTVLQRRTKARMARGVEGTHAV